MEVELYYRIKELCSQKGITLSKLESDLGFSNGCIKKLQSGSSPSVDKAKKVADYFDISLDYLLGRSEIPDLISDEIITLQRARCKMSAQDQDKMMKMLKIAFDYAFEDTVDENGDTE